MVNGVPFPVLPHFPKPFQFGRETCSILVLRMCKIGKMDQT
uniref:Uncharacterized protein n=1 Tax=Arundo donax TaxID=35708 RepID=A0A0A9GNP7_ARUDO